MDRKVFHKNVPDCEHEGDIEDTMREVEDAGGVVFDTYWDGQDCGEAYVEFTIPDGVDKEEVFRKLHIR